MKSPLAPPIDAKVFDLPGLEADNLLAFLALLGLVRAIETVRPDWCPRVSWKGPPWVARLHLTEAMPETDVVQMAAQGIDQLVASFDVAGRKNVDFSRTHYREYAKKARRNPTSA